MGELWLDIPEVGNIAVCFYYVDLTEPWCSVVFVQVHVEYSYILVPCCLQCHAECPRTDHGTHAFVVDIIVIADRVILRS